MGKLISPRIRRKFVPGIFIYSILGFVFIISVFPILWVIISAFKENSAILGNPFQLPRHYSFIPFINVFVKYNFRVYMINSIVISSISTIVSLFIYSMGAYAIAKTKFAGRNLVYILFTVTLLVPGHAKAQPIFALINYLSLYDTRLGLILVYISFGLAISIFILRTTFLSIPKSLDEAAYMEGANFWQVFCFINIPLAKSGLTTAGILMFLGNWNEYFYALLLTSSQKSRTLPLALAFFTEEFSYNYTQMFAALTIVILPGIVIYIVAQEQVQSSLSSTGIKG